jgi:DNA polymerase-1
MNLPTPTTSAEAVPTLLVVDGHAYAYRAFYAIRQLTSPSGAPTNAIYGFIKMLHKMRARLKPTHIAVAWDGGLATERMALLPDYKAQRPDMPVELKPQLDELMAYLQAARIASICEAGVEADDRIATLAKLGISKQMSVIIASSDKDFMQLVSGQVGLFNPSDKSETVWSFDQVRAKTGVEPGQIVDWLSLIGDAVDNIPGVRGVGPKTATDLLEQFGSIAAIYENPGAIKSERLRSGLMAAKDTVHRNQDLIRLRDDLPGPRDMTEFAVRPPDDVGLHALYSKWGFNSLRQELEESRLQQTDFLQ